MRPAVHMKDPTRDDTEVSPRTNTMFQDTTLCRRKPAKHGLYVTKQVRHVTCWRCTELLAKNQRAR